MSTSVFPNPASFAGSPRSPLLAYLQTTGTNRKFLLEKVEHSFALIFPEISTVLFLCLYAGAPRVVRRRASKTSLIGNFFLAKAERFTNVVFPKTMRFRP
jgi:hypothetical protein